LSLRRAKDHFGKVDGVKLGKRERERERENKKEREEASSWENNMQQGHNKSTTSEDEQRKK
jgi:hypothetical protein